MRTKISIILILSLLAVAFVAMSAHAVKSPDESPRVNDPRLHRSLQYYIPDANNTATLNANPAPVLNDGVSLGQNLSSAPPWPGVKIGDTYFDQQHYGRMTRMVDWGNDVAGGEGFMVHFGWMRLATEVQENRSYAYNVYYAQGGGAGTFLGQTTIQPEGEYAGYVSLDVTDDGRAVLGGHNNQGVGTQPHTYWDWGCGLAFFGMNRRVEDSVIAAGTGQSIEDSLKSCKWPSMRYQDVPWKADPVLHLFTQVDEIGDGPQAIVYFRKVGENDTGEWDYPPYVVDTVFDIAQDVACSNYDGKVALTWIANLPDPGDCDTCSSQNGRPHPQWDNDIYFQISNDYGATWNPRINLTQNVDGEDGFRPYTDLQSLITSDNDLHIVWSGRVWPADANYGGEAGLLRCRIFHWGENLGFIRAGNIRTVVALDWDQTICNGGAWQLNASKMNISECDGKLYCLWTQFNDPDVMMNDCHSRAGTDPAGSANGELYMAVSADGGLTWDGARNLTNTHTPGCDSASGEGACLSEHWSSMNRIGTNLTGDMSGAEIVDPSGGYSGSYFLDVLYIGDIDPGSIVQDEGTWQQADVRWFRLPCVEPVPTPGFVPSWTEIDFPSYTKPGTQFDKWLLIENPGNIATTVNMAISEDAGVYSNWLTVDASLGASGEVTINSGLGNTITGNVTINAGGTINPPSGTIVHLSGNMYATGNFVGSPFVFPIDFWIVDSIIFPTYDTVTTGCFSLVVSNVGNWGNQGAGEVNLDYFDYGDCDNAEPGSSGDTIPGDASIYVYDASPVICWTDAYDTVRCNWSIFGQGYQNDNSFFPQAHVAGGKYYTRDTCDGNNDSTYICDTYYSQFVTRDTGILIEKWWYMPSVWEGHQDVDGANFIVQVLKISRHPLAEGTEVFDSLNIGEAIDWDIPSDSASRNRSGFDDDYKLIYQQGSEYDDDPNECQENSDRYGGIELLNIKEVDGGTTTETSDFYGAYTACNSIYVYDTWLPYKVDSLMGAREGYVLADSVDVDLHTMMTFKSGYNLTATKELWIYKCLITSRIGHAAFIAAAAECHTFYDTYLKNQYASCEGEYPCGDADCDGAVDISDLVHGFDYVLTGGPPSLCPYSADVDDHEIFTIHDVKLLWDWMMLGGSEPICPPSHPPLTGPTRDSIFLHTYESSFPSQEYFPEAESTYTVHVRFTTDVTLDVVSLPFNIRIGNEIPIIESATLTPSIFESWEDGFIVDQANGILMVSGFADYPGVNMQPGTYEIGTIKLAMPAQDSVWRPIVVEWDSMPPIQDGGYTHYPFVTEPSGQVWIPSIYRLPCIQPIRGDMDYNGAPVIDIADLVYVVDYMFNGGRPPRCFEEVDIDLSTGMQLDIGDLVYLVDYMFTGGPPPPPCPPE